MASSMEAINCAAGALRPAWLVTRMRVLAA
jgi:hypothetical protein